ncbi:MAG: GNAT family N-acetyltransferase [Rhizobiaceae bacterium]
MPLFPPVRYGFRVEELKPRDAARLQPLFEACADYAFLEGGEAVAANAAAAEFEATPPGRTTADKFMLGLLNGEERIVGLIAADRGWPEDGCWWLGLMLVDPAERGTGLAPAFAKAYFDWVNDQGAERVELAAFDENKRADRFWRSLGFEHLRSTEPRVIGRKTHVLHVMRLLLAG